MSLHLIGLIVISLIFLVFFYVIGRLAETLALPKKVVQKDLLLVTSAPLVGLSVLALELGLFSLIHLPWNRWLLILPWVIVGIGLLYKRRLNLKPERLCLKRLRLAWRQLNYPDKILLAVSLFLMVVYLISLLQTPILEADILVIWAFKAKVFFMAGGVHFNQQLVGSLPTIRFRHSDYPPLYSVMGDVVYVLIGHISETFFKFVTFVFLVSGIGGLLVLLKQKLGISLAIVLTTLLLCLPQLHFDFLAPDNMAHADFPIGILLLLTGVYLAKAWQSKTRSDRLMALFLAMIAAMIKNEGLTIFLITLVFIGGQILFDAVKLNQIRNNYKVIAKWAGLMLIMILPIIIWQIVRMVHHIPDTEVSLKLSYVSRSRLSIIDSTIWAYLKANPVYYGQLVLSLWVIVVAIVYRQRATLVVCGLLVLQALSYYLSYVFAFNPLVGVISSSIERLLFQMAPLTILAFGLSLQPKDKRSWQLLSWLKRIKVSKEA